MASLHAPNLFHPQLKVDMRVILIDGKNAAFRFAWTNRNLTDDDGHPTGATLGIIRVLLGLKKRYPDARFAVAWDGQRDAKYWRSVLFPGYKIRKGDPPALVAQVMAQMEDMHDALDCLCVPQMEVDNVEADDLVGMLAAVLKIRKHDPVVFSGDFDYAQLARYGVGIIQKGTERDPYRMENTDTLCARYNCSLKQILMVRALEGDTSDKIPSPGRGAGTHAAEIILAGVRPDQPTPESVTPALAKKYPFLIANWDAVHRNYRLMQIQLSWNVLVYSRQASKIKSTIASTLKQLNAPLQPDGKRLTEFLLDKQFISLMKERKRLLRLNF